MVNSSLSFNFLVVVVSLLKMAEASEKEAKKDANQDKCSGSSTHDKDKTGKVMETKKKPEEVSPAKRPRLGPASKVGLSPSRPASSSSDPAIYFSGHHAYIVRVAQTCRASGTYTDVNIQCEDGEIRAHR